jgi:hypothetical protein
MVLDPQPDQRTDGGGVDGPAGTMISPPSGLDTPYSDSAESYIPENMRHHIEMYLIHRFKSSVSTAFPSAQSPYLKDIYVWHAVDAAFDHPFLLNAIFATTTLYIWKVECAGRPTTPGDDSRATIRIPDSLRDVDFAQLHRAYLNLTISQERDALSSLSSSNADAVGLTSILLSMMATCLLPDSNTYHGHDESTGAGAGAEYYPPVQWLTLAGAISIVFQAAVPYLKEGAMMRYLRDAQEPSLRIADLLSSAANAAPFSRILDFQESNNAHQQQQLQSESDPTTRQAYRDTLTLLGSVYNAIQAGEPEYRICMRVVAFGAMAPKAFVGLLAQKRPRALVTLAHYMAFVKYIDSYWWFKGRAEKEILGIQNSLPHEWQWALRWPLAVLASPQTAKLDPNGSSLPGFDGIPDKPFYNDARHVT